MEQTPKASNQLRRVGRPPKVVEDQRQPIAASESFTEACNKAQALALRIWGGQSMDVPYAERVRRVAAGLEAQGFSVEQVGLPEKA